MRALKAKCDVCGAECDFDLGAMCESCESMPDGPAERIKTMRQMGLTVEAEYLVYLWKTEKLADEDLERDPRDLRREAAEERAYLQGVRRATKQKRSSTNLRQRGLGRRTLVLRDAILAALDTVDKPVTVRQAFYLTASRGDVSKDESGYRRVQSQMLAMRREQVIPYGWVADNTRWRIKPDTEPNLESFLRRSARFYRQDLWVRSDVYLEIWCEKDSIAGVISPITDEYDVPLYVARGYSSETFAHAAAAHMQNSGKEECFAYYVGDFDPSGWDASRDLEQRLTGFYADAQFERLAIQPEHVEQYDLITRETKRTDTRCRRFFDEHGHGQESCELEALNPDVLRTFIRDAIEKHVDMAELEALRREEEVAREALVQIAETYEGAE